MSPRAEFSKRTKLIAWNRSQGRCEQCTAKLFTGNIEYHHVREATFNGLASLDNCMVLCRACHRTITKSRAPLIAKSNRQRAAYIGLRKNNYPPIPGTKRSGWKKRMDGTVERRNV